MSLVIETVSKSEAARRDLDALNKSVNSIEASVKSATSGFQKMALGIGSAVAAFGTVSSITAFADSFTELENRIKSVTNSQKDFTIALEGIKDIAIQSRGGLKELASLYGRIAINAKEIGINQKDMLRVTSAVSKSMKIAGASTAEANAAMMQFGQAIGSGALQGDELRSLLENAPNLAASIAKEFNTSVGNLKKMGEEGKLISSKVLKAILADANNIDEKFKNLKVTFGGAFSNLGTSIGIFLNTLTKSILGSDGFGIAEYINNLAIGIKKVSDNFKFYLLKIKTAILFFVVDAKQLFEALLPTFDAIGTAAVDSFKYIIDNWEPLLNKGYDTIAAWASNVSAYFSNLFDNVSSKGLVTALIDAAKEAYDTVSGYITNLFRSIDISSFAIDVTPFFKGFQPALDFIQYWVNKVERAFFWLYDQVIGHSWIPDLVIETGEWLQKLFGKPIGYIKAFTEKSSSMFSKIAFAAPFVSAIAATKAFGLNLGTVSALATTTVGTLAYLGSKGFFGDTLATKIKGVFDNILQQYKDFTKKFEKNFAKTTIGHTIKQILGQHDSTPGSVFGVPIDTREKAKVGRGPMRSQEVRPFGHDVLNALPKDWQIPALAAVTSVFGLAIVKAFDSGPVRSVLLSALTTAFGLAVVQNVDDSQIKKTTAALGYGFVDIVGRGLDAVLGKNALQDPFGTISLVAKTSLLFEDGRKAIISATKTLATAPTSIARNFNDVLLKNRADSKVASTTKEIAELPTKLNDAVAKANAGYNSALTRLANMKDNTGQTIGALRAMSMVQQKQLDSAASGLKQASALNIAIAAQNKANSAIDNLANIKKIEDELTSKRTKLEEAAKGIGDRLKAAGDAFKDGVRNISSGIGGTLGGLGGYQIGASIARAMGDDVSNWQKIGITIATSIAGQGVGALIGSLVANAIIFAGTAVATAFSLAFTAAPFITGAVLIAAALAAGYLLFEKLPESWKKALGMTTSENREKLSASLSKADKQATDKTFNQDSVKELAESIRENTKGWNGMSANMAVMGTNLNVWQRQQVINAANEPSPEERARNLAALEDFKNIPSRVYDAIGNAMNSVRNWATGGKFASGGMISGPGSGTSDSIPAMLSNGEFVVNAKATARNRSLLESINSGKSTAKFAAGGYVGGMEARMMRGENFSANNPLEVRDSKLSAKIDNEFQKIVNAAVGKDGKFDFNGLLTAVKGLAGTVVTAVGDPKKAPELGGGGGAPDTRSKFRRALEGKDPNKAIADALGGDAIKIKGFDAKAVANLSQDTKGMLAESLDNIARAQEKAAKETSPFLKGQLQNNIAEQIGVVNDILRKADLAGETPSTFNYSENGKEGKGKKPKEVLFGDQLKIINETFPELGLTLDEFINTQDSAREALFASAEQIYNESNRIMNLPIGKRNKDKTTSGTKEVDGANEALKANEDARKKAQEEAIASREASRSLFQNVERIFQEVNIGLSKGQINGLLKEDADMLFGLAKELRDLNKAQDAVKDDPAKRLQFAELIKGKSEAMQNAVADALKRSLVGYDKMQTTGQQVGVQVERAVYNRLSDNDRSVLQGYLDSITNNERDAKEGGTEELRKAAQKRADKSRKDAQDVIDNATAKLSKFDEANAATSKAGVYLEKALYNRLTDAEQTWVTNTADKIKEEQDKVNAALDEASRITAQKKVDELTEGLVKGLERKKTDVAKEAGKSFASQFRSDFASALTGALKGDAADNRTVLQTFYDKILDSTTNSVLDSFSKGVTNKLFGEGSSFAKTLESIGGGVGGTLVDKLFPSKKKTDGTATEPGQVDFLGGGVGGTLVDKLFPSKKKTDGTATEPGQVDFLGGLQGVFSDSWGWLSDTFSQFQSGLGDVFKNSSMDFGSIFSSFGTDLGGMFKGIKGMFGGGGGGGGKGGGAGSLISMLGTASGNPYLGLASMLFAADGGAVSGPGTARSDSIPAMLSNGEFVVNAKSTKQFAPLLHAINSGSLYKFADGGVVGAQVASIGNSAAISTPVSKGSTSAVFNLNITGDVSSQTRNEIQRMIPQIAYGVNSHNRESGRRG